MAAPPFNDRRTIYNAMAKWSFVEGNQINFNLLDWIEKTVLVHQPILTKSRVPAEVSPQKFLESVASQNGIWLKRLAIRLGSSGLGDVQNRGCYEVFFEFARNNAKLAQECIFSEKELLGVSPTHKDYKSVFYTIYTLANQARDKFRVPTLAETQQIGWPELNKKKRKDRKKCAEREEFNEMMVDWSFEEVKKKNKEIIKWLGANGTESNVVVISPENFLAFLSTNAGKNLLQNLSKTADVPAEQFYDNFRAFAKSQLPDECIFWESELNGASYEDYKAVFCTLHMLMKKDVSAKSNSQQKQPETKSMQIFVKTPTGTTITLGDCYPDNSVLKIKERIEAREGIPVEQMRLIFSGRQLEDDRLLRHYNVQKESTIHLLLKLLNCVECPKE